MNVIRKFYIIVVNTLNNYLKNAFTISVFVIMPTKFPLSFTTGSPLILFLNINFVASEESELLLTTIGLKTHYILN